MSIYQISLQRWVDCLKGMRIQDVDADTQAHWQNGRHFADDIF